MNNFKLNAGAFTLGTSTIKIALESLPDNIKIVDAILSVKVQSVTTNSEIPVHYSPIGSSLSSEGWENVDNVTLSADDILKINISDELQDALHKEATHLQLNFGATNITFAIDPESDFINIDYISLAEFQSNGNSHKINLGKSGQASVDLVTGRLSVSSPLVNTDSNVLPLSISANYHSVENKKIPNDTGLPKNWHLNVNQFLIKENDPDGDLRFTYIDENGRSQKIEEKYYYDEDNNKVYVKRNQLQVDLDGNYIFGDRKIKTELIAPSGLNLVSSISDIKGSHLVDYEPEELINVKKQLKTINQQIDEIKKTRQLNNEQLLTLILTKELIEKQHNSVEHKINQNKDYLSLKEKIEKIRMVINQKNRSFRDRDDLDSTDPLSYATTYLSGKNYDYKKISEIYDYYLNNKSFLVGNGVNDVMYPSDVRVVADILANESCDVYSLGITNPLNKPGYQATNIYESSSNSFNGTIALEKENSQFEEEIYTSPIEVSTFNTKVESIIKAIVGNKININNKSVNEKDLLDSYITELSSDYFIDTTTTYNNIANNRNITLSLKDLLTIELQIKSIVNSNLSYQSKEAEYLESKKQLEHKQKLYEAQVPVHYLYNESNIIYGFGKTFDINQDETDTFRLILISDAYENTIFINYESLTSNHIDYVKDASDNIIKFEYDTSGYLNNIIDARNRKTTINIEASVLKEIIHNNQRTLFSYNNEYLQGVLTPSGMGIKFTYKNNQVHEIIPISVIEKIDHDEPIYKASYISSHHNFINCLINDQKVCFTYNDYKSTSISNLKNKVVTYIFDSNGNVRCIYENNYIGDTNEFNPEEISSKVTTFNHEDSKSTFKVSKLPYSINYLEDVHFDTGVAIVKQEALSLGSLICGEDCIPYSYPVYSNYYSMPNTKDKLSVIVSDDMVSKINDITCSHKTFMLSGWAKSNSAFVITDESIEDFPLYVQNRKFEIRAEITYIDGTIDKTNHQSFDWRNTNWQYCALPIVLQNKTVVKIECFIDYANNTNIDLLMFTDLELKQGDFEKTEFNSKNRPIKKSTGHSEWETCYTYDTATDLLVSEIITSKNTGASFTTYYEYNQNGKLIKTIDYNNIIKEQIYNDKGSVIKSITYHKDEPANILQEELFLDDKGQKTHEVNELGEKVYDFNYADGTGIISSTIDTTGVKTSYGYANDDILIQATTSIDGQENTNIYGYTLDFLTSLTHNDFSVKYSYDDQGRKTQISIADNDYLIKNYGKNEEITTLGNGESYKNILDDNGNILEIYYKKSQDSEFTLIIQNIYDIYGNLVYRKDITDNVEKINTYEYDNFGQIISEESTQHNSSVIVETEFDDNHSNINHSTIEIDETKIEYNYIYSASPDAKLESITSPLGSESITYDNLGRIKSVDSNIIQKEVNYLKVGSLTSNLVSKINFATNNVINDNLTYKYDEKGNIAEVRQYNKLLARYKYDALSRIVREDNKDFDTTTTFEYDAGGNILCKKVYAFTIIDNLDFEDELEYIPYSYPISGWRDQLLSYNDESFEYDNLGNPTKYCGKVLQWSHGRQLDKFADIATYTYNANGIRTSKTYYTDKSCQCESETNTCTCQDSDCFTTKFFLNGNKIIKQHDCCNDLTFYYGADGLTGFHIKSTNAVYNNENLDHNFFYKKNLQGDIIGIIDSNGNEIVKYVYDAWGNHKAYNAKSGDMLDISSIESYTNTDNIVQFIAIKNPFRYRSYYYDFETGLYYLNSRYYDPETGRFINADDISILSEGKEFINGLNLYLYCNNNPIMNTDETGNAWWDWLFAALVAVVVIALVVVVTVATAGIGTAVAGALGGGVAATIFGGAVGGAITGAITGAIIGGGISIVSQGLTNGFDNINWGQVGVDTLIGAASGFVTGAITGAISSTIKIANAAKMWDKGTFKSGYQSMKYHYKTHVINQGFSKGNNIIKYTNDAISFMNKNSFLLKFTYSSKYDMIRWIYSTDTAQGFYTSLGKIITFILKG